MFLNLPVVPTPDASNLEQTEQSGGKRTWEQAFPTAPSQSASEEESSDPRPTQTRLKKPVKRVKKSAQKSTSFEEITELVRKQRKARVVPTRSDQDAYESFKELQINSAYYLKGNTSFLPS